MSRLETWIAEEVASYEKEYGSLDAERRAEFKEALKGTLHGQQLRVADGCGVFGDAMLAALKEHSDALRDSQLREWFRRR